MKILSLSLSHSLQNKSYYNSQAGYLFIKYIYSASLQEQNKKLLVASHDSSFSKNFRYNIFRVSTYKYVCINYLMISKMYFSILQFYALTMFYIQNLFYI